MDSTYEAISTDESAEEGLVCDPAGFRVGAGTRWLHRARRYLHTAWLCSWSTLQGSAKAALEHSNAKGCSFVPIKLY